MKVFANCPRKRPRRRIPLVTADKTARIHCGPRMHYALGIKTVQDTYYLITFGHRTVSHGKRCGKKRRRVRVLPSEPSPTAAAAAAAELRSISHL